MKVFLGLLVLLPLVLCAPYEDIDEIEKRAGGFLHINLPHPHIDWSKYLGSFLDSKLTTVFYRKKIRRVFDDIW